MISPEHAQTFARYNIWQTRSHFDAAATLAPDALTETRGAFFGSILATLNHILWADEIWMSRFSDVPKPEGGIGGSTARYTTLSDLRMAREAFDDVILKWTNSLTIEALGGDVSWYSGATQRDQVKPLWLCVAHMFNHATHHRGQVHAMLTQAGAKLEDTDIVFMPGLDG